MAPPFEEIEIRTRDGAVLRAEQVDPPDGVALRATVVLAHAMFARRSSFGRRERPGLAQALAACGFRTVAFDFRGHGQSRAPEREWAYDDLVRHDAPTVVASVRARADGGPVLFLGHSLGGHVGLAAQGTGRLGADALVVLGANAWIRAAEPSGVRWAVKRLVARAGLVAADRAGRFPARRLRMGSDDESIVYIHDVFRRIMDDGWTSADGVDDYWTSLGDVTVPTAAVLGARDRILCHPTCGEIFARRCGGDVRVLRADADHMGLARANAVVLDAVAWAAARVRV